MADSTPVCILLFVGHCGQFSSPKVASPFYSGKLNRFTIRLKKTKCFSETLGQREAPEQPHRSIELMTSSTRRSLTLWPHDVGAGPTPRPAYTTSLPLTLRRIIDSYSDRVKGSTTSRTTTGLASTVGRGWLVRGDRPHRPTWRHSTFNYVAFWMNVTRCLQGIKFHPQLGLTTMWVNRHWSCQTRKERFRLFVGGLARRRGRYKLLQ